MVTEDAPEDRGPRGERVRARWPLDPSPPRLLEVVTQHAAGREGTCIHAGPRYGTRSSTILRLAEALSASDLLTTAGRPCETPLDDQGALLAALVRRAGDVDVR